MENTNTKLMNAAGYYIAETVEGLPGVRMYAGGPGVMEIPATVLRDVMVSESGVDVFHHVYSDGKYCGFQKELSFSTVPEFVAWVSRNGKPCLGGLPAGINGWD